EIPQLRAVAYLDIGAGGYIDLGSDLTNEQLEALPWGRHMLGIIGTYGPEGYVAAAPIEQTAPQPEQSGLVDMVRLALHNGQLVPDPEMDGSTEVFGIKIDDMEALEAALSAQGESHE